jgi:hypothetical protein
LVHNTQLCGVSEEGVWRGREGHVSEGRPARPRQGRAGAGVCGGGVPWVVQCGGKKIKAKGKIRGLTQFPEFRTSSSEKGTGGNTVQRVGGQRRQGAHRRDPEANTRSIPRRAVRRPQWSTGGRRATGRDKGQWCDWVTAGVEGLGEGSG